MTLQGGRAADALVLAILGFMLTVDLRTQDAASSVAEERRAELIAAVRARQGRTAQLESELTAARSALVASIELGSSTRLRELSAQTTAIAPLAGAAAVIGPATVITVADADDAAADDADFRIQDIDLQHIVNALWAAGAEALAVNGQRVVGTTAIRNAGSAILINYRVLTSPYRIVAIGDPGGVAQRFRRSATGKRFEAWRATYGLGYKIDASRRARVPGYNGTIRLRYADPIEDP